MKIVLGGGCFWCTEAAFSMLNVKVTPGYAGGSNKNPTYKEVCRGNTGHAEVIKVEYDDSIKIEKLLKIFFMIHDPTLLNKQGNDVGSQYRSIILYTTEEQKKKINNFIKNIQKNFDKPIVTEIKKLDKFYPAEDYHKEYYKNNPLQHYCMFVIRPKINKIKKELEN